MFILPLSRRVLFFRYHQQNEKSFNRKRNVYDLSDLLSIVVSSGPPVENCWNLKFKLIFNLQILILQ